MPRWAVMRPFFSALAGGAEVALVLLGLDEGVVVALVLVGVGLGELGDGAVERVTRAQVRGDGDAVTGAGVRLGEGGGTEPGVHRHGGRVQRLDEDGSLPVAELADVVVALDAVDALHLVPAEE